MHERDGHTHRQTDTHTPHDDIGHTCIASHDKNEQQCIGQCCWHDFVIKDATVKQVTLNVIDMGKVNIVSSQAVLEVM